MDYQQQQKLEQLLNLINLPDPEADSRVDPERLRDEQGRFVEHKTSSESNLADQDDWDDPHWQWVQTSDHSWELEWCMTAGEKFFLGGATLGIMGWIMGSIL